MHLIFLFQFQDDARTSSSIISILCSQHKLTIPVEISSDHFVFIVEIRIELVGSVLRDDEFPIIGVTAVVNVAASDFGDDFVEFDYFA